MKDSDLLLLLVEDNPDDVFLMQRAFKKTNLSLPMHVVTHGSQALDYLSGAGDYADRQIFPLPAAVFLDLKLPYVHGFEILKWMRQNSLTRSIPVFILTSSLEDRDRSQAFELGAQAYLVKPPTPQMILEVVKPLRNGAMTGRASPNSESKPEPTQAALV